LNLFFTNNASLFNDKDEEEICEPDLRKNDKVAISEGRMPAWVDDADEEER